VAGGGKQKKASLFVESVLNACFLRVLRFLVNVDKRLGFLDKEQFRLLLVFFGGGFGFALGCLWFWNLFWESVMGRR
jgi:hypothetical protein